MIVGNGDKASNTYSVVSILVSLVLLVDWPVVDCEVVHLGVEP